MTLILLSAAAVDLASCSQLPPRGGEQSTMACPSVVMDDYYFPVGILASGNRRADKFARRWYSSHLLAMGEPSLSCGAGSTEAYRFLWLRAFHRPISVRIVQHQHGAHLTLVELDGSGGYAPGKVAIKVDKELSQKAWDALTTVLNAMEFWTMPTTSDGDDRGTNGAQWIIEGWRNETYHVADRWSPRTGLYREAGIEFLKAAGVKVVEEELY